MHASKPGTSRFLRLSYLLAKILFLVQPDGVFDTHPARHCARVPRAAKEAAALVGQRNLEAVLQVELVSRPVDRHEQPNTHCLHGAIIHGDCEQIVGVTRTVHDSMEIRPGRIAEARGEHGVGAQKIAQETEYDGGGSGDADQFAARHGFPPSWNGA